MPDIYESFTTEETTSKILDENRLVNFAYDDTAFRDNDTKWKGYYDYNAHNNIQDTPILPESVQNGGFNETSGVFKRTFVNHYFGRISYNLNKAIQALKAALGSFRADYSENISEYSEYAGYAVGDVCYRLNSNTITFYRCKSKITAPAGTFNGAYWEKPEEELSHDRPVIGVPVMWFEKVPDDATLGVGKGWAIRFDDGAHYTWEQCPALNFSDFRALVTVDADDTGFTVPDFRDKVPMLTGGDNEVQTGYNGSSYTATVQAHSHTAPALTFAIPASSVSHTHLASCGGSGNHQHELDNRCNYDGYDNTSKLPVDEAGEYAKNTITISGGSHTHPDGSITTDGNISGHTHTVTVTGYTGPIKETAGGNPDSFQGCWIVRYK